LLTAGDVSGGGGLRGVHGRFAYNAIEEAEYAVLDAVLASMDGEAAASKVPS
jgi:hypothetical protein